MTVATVSTLEQTVHKTNQWLDELGQDLQTDHRGAYRAMRAVLHALRDRLTVQEATDLGAQLPMLVRGFYYEAYNPSDVPTNERHAEAFLQRIAKEMQDVPIEPQDAASSVFKLLTTYCTAGQISHVKSNLPRELQAMWPQ